MNDSHPPGLREAVQEFLTAYDSEPGAGRAVECGLAILSMRAALSKAPPPEQELTMKFRYYIIMEDYTVRGLHSEEEAIEASEWAIVLDAQEGVIIDADGEGNDEAVEEYVAYAEEETEKLPADTSSTGSIEISRARKRE